MIYLKLFLTFLEVGAVSFGGGYGMISLISELAQKNGWLTEEQLMNYIAVSESTPGPIAVNMATFIGSAQGGILGAFLATLGVIFPAFLIILMIVIIFKNFLKYAGVNAFLSGVRPCAVALIFGTGIVMFISVLFGLTTIKDSFSINLQGIVILLTLIEVNELYKMTTNKKPSPILMILIAAVLGILIYSF